MYKYTKTNKRAGLYSREKEQKRDFQRNVLSKRLSKTKLNKNALISVESRLLADYI